MITRSTWMAWCVGMVFLGQVWGQSEEDAILPFYNEFGPGSRAMALGGAYSALAEDFTAVYWNPAGLAQIRKMEFYGALSHFSVNNQIGYQGTTTEATTGFTRFNSIGAVFPIPTFRGSLVFGIGYSRINQFDDFMQIVGNPIPNPSNGLSFHQDQKVNVEGGLGQWSFAGAVDLTANLSIGGTLNIVTGRNNNSVTFFADDRAEDADPPSYNVPMLTDETDVELNQDYTGFSMKMGTLFKPTPDLRIGLTISSPTYLSVEEDFTYSEVVESDTGLIPSDYYEESYQKFDLTSPWRFELGAAYKYKLFTGTASVEFVDWTQTRFDSKNDVGDNDINNAILTNYRGTVSYRVGGEFIVPNLGMKVMAGFMSQPSPFKKNLEAVNSDRKYLSGGLSFLLDKQVKVDLGYQYGWWNRSKIDYLLGYDVDGVDFATDEKITTSRFLISISHRF